MPRNSFTLVQSIGRTLPDVEVTTTWGQPTLKVRGKMFVCIASHKSAEPDTLVVMMDFADRDALIEEDPDTYYLKEHYVELSVRPRPALARASRRASGPRHRRTPLRERKNQEESRGTWHQRHSSPVMLQAPGGLVDECPVIHAGMRASRTGVRAVGAWMFRVHF